MKTIRKNEYIFLCYFIMSSMFWGITSYVLLQTSYRDSWLSIIISLVLGIIPLILFYLTLNLSPCDNIVSLINKHFGKFGIVINITSYEMSTLAKESEKDGVRSKILLRK